MKNIREPQTIHTRNAYSNSGQLQLVTNFNIARRRRCSWSNEFTTCEMEESVKLDAKFEESLGYK